MSDADDISRNATQTEEGQSGLQGAVQSGNIREEQIANAVAFLSHPKVRSSPVDSKRQFLVNKGLTEAEIDEAFRRVPESSVPSLPASTLQATSQHLQPAPYASAAAPTHQHGAAVLQAHPPHQQEQVGWSQVLLGAGFTAAGAYAVKSLVWPYVTDAYSSWRGTRKPAEPGPDGDTAAGAGEASTPVDGAAAQAVAEAIKEQTSELREAIQSIKQVANNLHSDSGKGGSSDLTKNDLRQELKAFAATLNELTPPKGALPTDSSLETELAEIKNLLATYLKTPRSGSVTPSGGGANATPSSSGFPSPMNKNIEDILRRDGEGRLGTVESSPAKSSAASFHSPRSGVTTDSNAAAPAKPSSYMEVLEMLEKGETPPGIRTDINDKPPNPEQPPPPPRMKPLPKPWERASSGDAGSGATPGQNAEETASSDNSGQASSSKPSSSISFNPQPKDNPATGDYISSVSKRESELGSDSTSQNGNASSIYKAATAPPAPDSPNVIAARFSPVKRYDGTGPASNPRKLNLEELNDGEEPLFTGPGIAVPDGNGLGRPLLRPSWRPPPIPSSSISSKGSIGASGGAPRDEQ